MASAASTLAPSTARRRSCAASFAKLGGWSRLTLGARTGGMGLARTDPSGRRRKVSR